MVQLVVEELESRLLLTSPFTPAFAAEFSKLLRDYGVPQGSLALMRDDGTLSTHFDTNAKFFTDNPNQPPAGPLSVDSLFRVASVSKSFAAAAIWTLVQAGQFSVSDNPFALLGYQPNQVLSGFDPVTGGAVTQALPAAGDSLWSMTVAQLLNMTSGLPLAVPANSATFPTAGSQQVIYVQGSYAALAYAGVPPYAQPASAAQQLEFYLYSLISNSVARDTPGAAYVYNDTNYLILGLIVEQYAGQLGLSYGEYLQTYVLGPMGIVPPSAPPIGNSAMVGLAHTLESQDYPTEVHYYSYDNQARQFSIFPDPNQLTAPFYPSTMVPEPYGGKFYIESHFGNGGLVATPTALARFFHNLSQAFEGSASAPLTQATLQQIVAEPSPLPQKEPAGGWFGLGWQVYTNNALPQDVTWFKNGDLPGTSSILTRNYDGTVWAATFNIDVIGDGTDSTAPDHDQNMFSQDLRALITQAVYGARTLVVTAGNHQSAQVGTAFATPLQVTALDYLGQPVPGISITFTAPGSGPSGSFPSGFTATVITNAQGVATAPTFIANSQQGIYQVAVAAQGDLNALADGASFTLANVAFFDNFDRADAETLGPDWQVRPSFTPARYHYRRQPALGHFQVDNDAAVGIRSNLSPIAAEQVTGLSLQNVTVQAEVDASDPQAIAVGLFARAHSNGDAYVAVLTHTGTAQILLFHGASYTFSVLGSTSVGTNQATMKLTVSGTGTSTVLELFLNGSNTSSVSVTGSAATTLNAPGGVGLYAWGSNGIIDNFSVSEL